VDPAVGLLLRATAASSRGAAALGYPATPPPAACADSAPEPDDRWAGAGGADSVRALLRAEAPALRRYVSTIAPSPPPRPRLRLVR
ncbi:hypothetical protein RM540_05705, partial [Rubrivirga sp. F394]